MRTNFAEMLRLVFVLIVFSEAECVVKFSSEQITLQVGEAETVQVELKNVPKKLLNQSVLFVTGPGNIVKISEAPKESNASDSWIHSVNIEALKAGKSGLSVMSQDLDVDPAFLLIKVHRSEVLEWLSSSIGWCYFLAWSVSFYPQICSNYARKSVVGLNFDFLLFNMFGYIMYNIFNFGVYFSPVIKEQYSVRHPKSLNPIRPNDIFFSAHSFFATVLTIFQSIKYEKDNQRVSTTARVMIQIYIAIVTTSAILAMMDIIWWLDVLYICSYIKLCVTIKKYVPQAYMNYQRKSTHGWSITGVTLDLVGGLLSIFQMILDGYNYDNWDIFVENPTKFGLGILSDGFCLTFLIQHYVLYRDKTNKNEMEMKSPLSIKEV